ncbi:MAG TPA: hypothetical protein VJC11_02465 [Patescibacteria group bacterium]|nr:hypothetical protein [Patescibacteria group bacterium]
MIKKISLFASGGLLVFALMAGLPIKAQTTGDPILTIVSPGEGEQISGDQVDVMMTAGNFVVVDFFENTANKAGEGHAHFWLDDATLSKDSAVMHTDTTLPYSFFDVQPGTHTLVAEIVQNDHTSLNPAIKKTITFSTTASQPIAVSHMMNVNGMEEQMDSIMGEVHEESAANTATSSLFPPINQQTIVYAGAIAVAALMIGFVLGESEMRKKIAPKTIKKTIKKK